MKLFTTVTITAAAAALMTAQAVARVTAPLAPGRPAGVHQAQISENLLIPVAIGAVAVGIIIAASSGGGDLVASQPVSPPTTTTTTATTTTTS